MATYNMQPYTPMRTEALGVFSDVTNTPSSFATTESIHRVPGAGSRAPTTPNQPSKFRRDEARPFVKVAMFTPPRPSTTSRPLPATPPVIIKPFVARHAVPTPTKLFTPKRPQCGVISARNCPPSPSSSSVSSLLLATSLLAETPITPAVAHSMSLDLARNLGPSIAVLETALQSLNLPPYSCSTISVQYLDLDRRVISKKVTLPPVRLPAGYEPPEELEETFSEVWDAATKLGQAIKEAEVCEKLVEVIPSSPWDEAMLFEEKLLPPKRVEEEVPVHSPRPVRLPGVRDIPILRRVTTSTITSATSSRIRWEEPLLSRPSRPATARTKPRPNPSGPLARRVSEQGEPSCADLRRGSSDSSGTASSRATTVTEIWDAESDTDSVSTVLTSEDEVEATHFFPSLKPSESPPSPIPSPAKPAIFSSEASRCAIDDPLFAFVRAASPETVGKSAVLQTCAMASVYDHDDADDEATGELFVSELGQLTGPLRSAPKAQPLPPIKAWRFKVFSPFKRR